MESSDRRIEQLCQALDILKKQPGGQKALASRMRIPESTLQQFRIDKPPKNPSEKTLETIIDYLLDCKGEDKARLEKPMRAFLDREFALRRLRNFRSTPSSFEHWINEARKLADTDSTLEGGGIGAASGALVGAFFGPLGAMIGAAIAGSAGAVIGAPSVERKNKISKLEDLYRERTVKYVTDLAKSVSRFCADRDALASFHDAFWNDLERAMKELDVKDAQIRQFESEFKNFPSIETLTGVSDFDLLRKTMEEVIKTLSPKSDDSGAGEVPSKKPRKS